MSSLFLHLARHGETADNARRVFQGQGGTGLNRLGRAQAARLAERFRHAPPAAIVTSDLERAVATARVVAEACAVPIELEEGLREVDVGAWTGKSHEEIASAFPEEWSAWESGVDVRRGGGETYEELAGRIEATMASIAGRLGLKDQRILVVSHGGAIRSWIGRLLGISVEGSRTLSAVGNCALTVVEWDARGRHRLHSWNDVAHLEGLVVSDHTD